MDNPILLEIVDQIAVVALNNPVKRNALSKPAWLELGKIMADLSERDDLRCVIIRGVGQGAFAAGADISEFPTDRSNSQQAEAYAHVVQETIHQIETCKHPVVAMIFGACTGGGLEIACACDMRLASENAKFGVPINRLGHTLAYPQLSEVYELVGAAVLSEMLLEGRVVDAQYALRVGLVNRVYEMEKLEEETFKTVGRIVKGAPLAARLHKKMLYDLKKNKELTEKDLKAPYLICDSEDYQKGFRGFINKEKVTFEGK